MTDNYFTNQLLYATDISEHVSIIQQLVLTIHKYMDNHMVIWSDKTNRSVILSLMVIHRIHRIVSIDSHIHPSVAYV